MHEAVGGWYGTRRQYRSVAFGTWKVGGERELSRELFRSKPTDVDGPDDEPPQICQNSLAGQFHTIAATPRKKRTQLGVDRNSRLGESSPDLCRVVHQTQTQLSLGLPNAMEERLTNRVKDFYSSSEYCSYLHDGSHRDDLDSCDGANAFSEPIQAAFRVSGGASERQKSVDRQRKHSLSSRRKTRQDETQRAHHRSHSAGADTKYSVAQTASTSTLSTMKLGRATTAQPAETPTNAKFLRATKKFFKKIYSSATLPKKAASVSTDNFQKAAPFFDIQYRTATLADDDDFSSGHDEASPTTNSDRTRNAMLDVSYPDSGLEMDRASTPDQSLESMTMHSKSETSSSDSQSRSITSQDIHDIGWTNIFEHLRREMHEMRERDAQILADLHKVESQLQSVRLAQMGYVDSSSRSNLELVESMQI